MPKTKIEPAMTPTDWKNFKALGRKMVVAYVNDPNGAPSDTRALVAMCNALLPSGDSAKITWQHVVALRSVLTQNPDNLPGYGVPLHELCEALESILPPPKNDWERGSLYGVPPK